LLKGGLIVPSKEFETVLKLLAERDIPESRTFEERRADLETATGIFKLANDIHCVQLKAGGLSAEWVVAPGAANERVILYLHGGGYAIGSINTHRELVSRISRAAQARALLIDYRLAPEHPHPAAVEDAVAAYRWLLAEGFDPSRIVIAGDSAGGGLTVAAAVALKNAGVPPPAALVCLSPWVDLELIGDSWTTKAEADPIVERDGIIDMANAYLGGKDPRTPLAAPLYADLSGLPPVLIQVGQSEVLLDDAVRLADRGKAAGMEVTLEPWEDMIHVWHLFASMLPEGQEAIDRIGRFVIEHTT
jgi:acetyl esterase/lipase